MLLIMEETIFDNEILEEEQNISPTVSFQDAEITVGIKEFINAKDCGFQGILKHKCSDFKVSEIGLDGSIVRISDNLFDESLKKTENTSSKKEELTFETLRLAVGGTLLDDEIIEKLLNDDPSLIDGIITPPIPDKSNRTTLHQTIRKFFNGRLQSETEGESIRIYRRTGTAGSKRPRDDRNLQQPDQHRYLEFVLRKENMDTIEAIQFMAKRLHVSSKDFSYAGTKDRRGVTEQKIVARNMTINKILGINKLFDDQRLRVSDVKVAKCPLNLGDLKGNRFGLVIRDVKFNSINNDDLSGMVEQFAKNGFINYFGLQRFGTSSVASYKIGCALLRGQWEDAVNLILNPRPGEPDQRAVAARKHWKETGDAKVASSMFPGRYIAERQILSSFSRGEDIKNLDYLGAILSINRELRLMYVHSVQSLIWNKSATERFSRYGRKLIVGDLVLNGSLDNPIVVNEDTLKDFSIEDMVLPLPGYGTTLPENDIGNFIKNLSSELFDANFLKPKNKSLWDLPGSYRKVFITPLELDFKIGNYSNPDDDLPKGFGEGDHLGLYVEFSLPSSSYATMAIRELMHCSSDPTLHKALTKRHAQTKSSQVTECSSVDSPSMIGC